MDTRSDRHDAFVNRPGRSRRHGSRGRARRPRVGLPGVAATLATALMLVAATAPPCRAQWTYFTNHSDIRALYEDGDTLWVATNGGVLFVSVLTGDVTPRLDTADGLPSNSTRVMLNEGGGVYIGGDDGLVACRAKGTAISCEVVGSYRDIRSLSVGQSGTLYIGTFGHGVAEVQGRRVTWTTTADSLIDNKVYAVREGLEGAVFFATSMGLCARLPTEWVSYQAGAGLPRGQVLNIVDAAPGETMPDRFGRGFYVIVGGRGIYFFDGRRARGILRRGLFREDDVAAIAVAGDGTLWAAGRYGGLARYRDGVWMPVGEGDDEIARARWRCVHAGRSGRVYFGSADGLLAAVAEGDVRKVTIPSAIPKGRIGPMAEDPSGRTYVANGPYLLSQESDTLGFRVEKHFGSVLAIAVSPDSVVWVAGRWGLYKRQSNRWLEASPDIDPKPPRFRSLAFDPSGCLWAGTETGQVFRFDGELWIRVTDPGEISTAAVDRLIVDQHGSVWTLSDSGLYSCDGSAWVRFDTGRLDSTGVVEFTVDQSGRPILLTRGSLWTLLADRKWQSMSAPPPDQIGEYRTIGFDAQGTAYLGTDKGIAVIGEGSFRWLAPGEGLRGRRVTSILTDRLGRLWVGFEDDGISVILLENL